MSVFLGLLKALAVLPSFYSMFEDFAAWCVVKRIASMKAENAEAIRKAVLEHDQRPIEKAIGSNVAGEPSGDPGTSIVDAPPIGVPESR